MTSGEGSNCVLGCLQVQCEVLCQLEDVKRGLSVMILIFSID